MNNTRTTEIQKQSLLKMFQGGILYAVAVVFGKILIFAQSIMLSRMIPINDLGVYYLGQTSVLLLAGFLVMGLDMGLIRFVAINKNCNNGINPSMLVTSAACFSLSITILVLGLMLFFLNDISVMFLKKSGYEKIFWIFLLTVPFVVVMRIFLSATRGLQIISYTALVEQVIVGVALFLLTAAVLFFNYSLSSIAFVYFLSTFLAFAASYYFMRRHFKLTFTGLNWAAFKPVAAFSMPLVLSQWMFLLVSYINTFMLAYWGISRDVALYNTTLRIMLVAEIVANSVVAVFNPIIAELVSQNRLEDLRLSYRSASRWVFMACCPFFVLTIFFNEIFLSVFGPKFIAASSCLVIICLSAIFEYSMPMLGSMIALSGHTKISLMNNLASLCVLLITGYFLIPKYALNGVALAWACSSIALTCLRLIQTKRLFQLQILQKSHFKIGGASLLAAGLLKLFMHYLSQQSPFIGLPLIFGIGIILYLLFVFIFGIENDDVFIVHKLKNKLLGGILPN